MDAPSLILFTISLVTCLAVLVYMNVIRRRADLGNIVSEAATKSAFSPTEFRIYDRSTPDTCDRLIVVSPFDWYIWACRGELYILNPEGGIRCGAGQSPAVRVLDNQFIETCLKLDFDAIISSYTSLLPHVVPYEINDKTFTILSALNILVKDYITFDADKKPVTRIKPITDGDEARKKRDVRRTQDDEPPLSLADELGSTSSFIGRPITARTVLRLMAQDKYDHTEMIDAVRRVNSKIDDRISDYRLLDPTAPDFATRRQNALNSHEVIPQFIR